VGVTNIDNAFMFSGEENSQYLTKEFTILWICQFNMMWYPFDTQTCAMQFKIVNKFADFVDLNPQSLAYSGPTDLTQYVVKSSIMCRASIGEYEGVEVNISLGRPLISNILTVFIPTIILLTISHISKVYDQRYIDMVIMVNLTVLLVLATFFIGISSTLPTTSYVKMIDIWMIFTMTFPLLEVALHTYKETLKLKLNQFGVPYDVSTPVFTKVQPLNPIESPKKEVQRLKKRMRFCEHLLDRVLPFAATGFTVGFCAIGIIAHFSTAPEPSNCF